MALSAKKNSVAQPQRNLFVGGSMNGKLKAFYESQGMTVVKNKAYGIVRGYETNALLVNTAWNSAAFGNNTYPYRFHISFFATSDQKAQMETALRNAALKYFQFTMTECGLQFSITGMTVGSIVKNLPSLFDTVYGIIADNGGKTSEYCPYCGESMESSETKKAEINGNTVTLDVQCVQKINSVIEQENADFNAAPNNYLRGFAGALIGALVGAAIAVVLALIGFIAAISAIVAVFLGTFLYQKFGGKPNKIMLVIVGVTTLVFMALAVLIAYIIASGIAVVEVGVNMGAIEAFVYCMDVEEFAQGFYLDLALSLVFSVVGMVIEIVIISRNIKRKRSI